MRNLGASRSALRSLVSAQRLQSVPAASLRHARCGPISRSVVAPISAGCNPRFFSHATASSFRQSQSRAQDALAAAEDAEQNVQRQQEPQLSLTFTCAVQDCGHRSSHTFSKRSYERGIVLVQCPNCKNRHLIADHLSWFTQSSDEPKTVEQMVQQNGGRIRKGVQHSAEGKEYETVEILSDELHPGKKE